jgi:phosphohistidine swiveling domain-containing protein
MSQQIDSSQPEVALQLEDWNAGLLDGGTYYYDSMHFPNPLAPLSLSIKAGAWAEGSATGFRDAGIPMKAFHSVGRNSYLFQWMEMAEFASPEEGQQVGVAIEARMKEEVGRLLESWVTRQLPATREQTAILRRLIAETATTADLNRVIEEALSAYSQLWRIHFNVVVPMGVAMQLFDEFHAEVFGGSEEDGHPLLAGQLNESVKAGFGLSDLASLARELGVANVILEFDSEGALARLNESGPGREWVAALNVYLDDYGMRQDLFDIATPTWKERPAYAITHIRNYLRSRYDARAHHAGIQQRAAEAIVTAREQLSAYPQPVQAQFDALLKMGQDASFLQEEHNFHIDQQTQALAHEFFREVGKRLVANGTIENADDVFMLTVEEIQSLVNTPLPQAETVSTRRASLQAAWNIVPPPFIGVPPAGPPPSETPADRGNIRFWGSNTPESDDPGIVMGNPGARGTATGLARVVRTLEEAAALEPGEILVTVTTMPPWSPLFGVAAAVVTETGGPLSHCAIVAREYEIPAVVGATRATSRIATGQRIRVDGSTGIIELDVVD